MIRTAILITVFQMGSILSAQELTCFDELMQIGNDLVAQTKYTEGMSHFEAARNCPDVTSQDDSLAVVAIINANNIWTTSLNRAIEKAEDEAAKAEKARIQADTAKNQAIRHQRKAERAEHIANTRANQAEASRLASLSVEKNADGIPTDAILLSLEAMDIVTKMDTSDETVLRAFNNAAFSYYATQIEGMEDGVLEVYSDYYGVNFAARSLGGELRLYKGNKLHFKKDLDLVYDIALPHDIDKNIVTVGKDSIGHSWSRSTLSNSQEFEAPTQTMFTEVMYDPFDESFITVGRDFKMYRWTTYSDPPIEFDGHTGPIKYLEFSPDGNMILSRSLDKTVRLWNFDGELIAPALKHDGFVKEAHFAADGRSVLTASTDGSIYLWDITGGLIAPRMKHDDAVTHAMFSPKNDYIFSTSFDGTIRIWSLDGKELSQLESDGSPVVSCDISGDGTRLMFHTKNGLIIICESDLNNQNKLVPISHIYHNTQIIDAHLSHNGMFVLTSDKNHAVKLWNEEGEEIMSPEIFTKEIWGSGFTPDGKNFWACSEDGTAWVCTLPDLILKGINDGSIGLPETPNNFKASYQIKD